MAIRWSPLAVDDSMDEVSKMLDQAEPFFKMAKARVKEAKSIPNIPDYMKQHLGQLDQELSRLDGVRRSIQRVRDALPKEELKKDRADSVIKRPTLIG